ncbi:MAG: hypothetical protein H6Q26_1034 [Bacteroidetes bacterium]|nr:hypothetical protein [Bacteroidota bacterium]
MSPAYEIGNTRNGDHEECRNEKTGFMQACSSDEQNMKQPGHKNADGSAGKGEPHMTDIHISDQEYGGHQQHRNERGGSKRRAE